MAASGQLTDVVGQLPEFSKWHGKAPLFFDSLDPAFAHLCRIEVAEVYFRVTHAIPKPSRKQAFLWYEIKPRAVTPASNKDALVWHAQYTRGEWVPNKFGAVQRSPGAAHLSEGSPADHARLHRTRLRPVLLHRGCAA
jgi:hypothetical protein